MQRSKERPLGAAPSRWALLFLLALVLAGGCGDDFDPDSALQQALAQQRAGNTDGAADLYQQVLEVRPGDKFANYNLGVIEQGQRRLALAEGYYRAAVDTDPRFTPALFNLAIVRSAAGATQEAIDLYQRVIEVKPDYAAAHFNLGLLYSGAGKEQLAEASINQALELDPSLTERLGPDALPSTEDPAASPSDAPDVEPSAPEASVTDGG